MQEVDQKQESGEEGTSLVGMAVVIIHQCHANLDPCCTEHSEGKLEEMMEEDRSKLFKAVWNLKNGNLFS
jgi:hypothetical protein